MALRPPPPFPMPVGIPRSQLHITSKLNVESCGLNMTQALCEYRRWFAAAKLWPLTTRRLSRSPLLPRSDQLVLDPLQTTYVDLLLLHHGGWARRGEPRSHMSRGPTGRLLVGFEVVSLLHSEEGAAAAMRKSRGHAFARLPPLACAAGRFENDKNPRPPCFDASLAGGQGSYYNCRMQTISAFEDLRKQARWWTGVLLLG